MEIQVNYKDKTYFTAEEAVANMKTLFGEDAVVHVSPSSSKPEDYIHFGLANLITVEQLELFFEFAPHGYPIKVEELKEETLKKVGKILDQVIKENEARVRAE